MQDYCCPNNVTSVNWLKSQHDTSQTHIQCAYYGTTLLCDYVSITYVYIHCLLASSHVSDVLHRKEDDLPVGQDVRRMLFRGHATILAA